MDLYEKGRYILGIVRGMKGFNGSRVSVVFLQSSGTLLVAVECFVFTKWFT